MASDPIQAYREKNGLPLCEGTRKIKGGKPEQSFYLLAYWNKATATWSGHLISPDGSGYQLEKSFPEPWQLANEAANGLWNGYVVTETTAAA